MRALLLALLLLALPACTSVQHVAAKAPPDPRTVVIYSGETGDQVAWEALLSAAAESEYVIVGENHGHPLGLAFAAALFEDILPRADHAALSLEFFERDEQSRLDEYLMGVTDEKTFRTRTQRSVSNYPPGHRDMVEAARAAGRPVIASNAPRPLVRLARTDSYDRLRQLTPELQRLFRIPDSLPTGRYAEDFRKVMHQEPKEGEPVEDPEAVAKRTDAMFRAQSLWDWTMADSVARAAAAGNHPIVHIVGRFHIDHRGGLVQALAALRPSGRITTISVIDDSSASLRDEDKGRADFVVYVGPAAGG